MPALDTTEFTSYNFSSDDYALAYTYTELQLQGIQTQLSKFAQQKINLSVTDFTRNADYLRAQEYNRGLMDGMRYLLELHSSLQEQVKEKLAEQQERQRDGEQTMMFEDPDQDYHRFVRSVQNSMDREGE